ncbi:Glutaminase [Marinobacterium lacunae]|uniref:Glutaminase n=1 Tax=Marinobacterium lacunae TaxID=1232683 RepID=A0A081FUG7_9GAMM|nr:glutaminase A [Marinobacterium lacunae]KEA62172.1 Glutaminase [Marinobacterium lacunae]
MQEPNWLQELIDHLHTKHASHYEGEIATYIPELGKANPDHFGVAVVTADGRVVEAGNSDVCFTIQSISKPLTYGMALEAYGEERVSKHVGVEPSGDAFNSIELEKITNRPFNPMVNAGAITVTAMLYQHYGERTFHEIMSRFSAAAGRQLEFDEEVYRSESRTGHRNRAIAYLLLNFGMVPEHVEAALDIYFKQCSILVNCRDLATIAATLSNLGTNPITKAEVFDIDRVKDMMSIMFTCGMYDYSGQWAYRVGVPAKSGVSGGVMSVVNRQVGIASYSPLLDSKGNSCRGINLCADLAQELGLHVFDCMNAGSSYLNAMLENQ